MLSLLVWGVLLVCIAGLAIAYNKTRDVFHPLVFALPMFAFVYWWMPLTLTRSELLPTYLDADQLFFVETLNLAGVVAFTIGCLVTTGVASSATRANVQMFAPANLRVWAASLAAIGLLAWGKSIANRGGFRNAFGTAYGGGWDDSGYVRDAVFLTLPAVLLVFWARQHNRARLDRFIVLGCSIPWLVQGLLGARRGPTFIITVIVIMSWYLLHGRRPPFYALMTGGAALGAIVLLLVVNRDKIYWGSDFDLRYDVSSVTSKVDRGNEFIYGSGAVINARLTDKYYWGRRYLMYTVIRPIPSSVWPTKYEDVGLPEVLVNGGTAGGDLMYVMGWAGTPGAAPGLVADLFIELSWLAIPALFAIGAAYGVAWSMAVSRGGVWTPLFVVMMALSMHLIMQGVVAVISPFLEVFLPVWLASYFARREFQAPVAQKLAAMQSHPQVRIVLRG